VVEGAASSCPCGGMAGTPGEVKGTDWIKWVTDGATAKPFTTGDIGVGAVAVRGTAASTGDESVDLISILISGVTGQLSPWSCSPFMFKLQALLLLSSSPSSFSFSSAYCWVFTDTEVFFEGKIPRVCQYPGGGPRLRFCGYAQSSPRLAQCEHGFCPSQRRFLSLQAWQATERCRVLRWD